MRVVSWNMAHTRRAWDYLEELDPDLALLQEANPAHTPDWVAQRWPSRAMWPPQSWGWGSALAKPHLDLTPYPRGPEGMEINGWLATATVKLPDGESAVIGSVHAPPFRVTAEHLAGRDPAPMSLPKYRTPRTFDVAYATYRERVRGRRFIVGGDWNISRDLWQLYHPKSHDADFFVRAEQDGWVDSYRRDHKHEGQTWFRAGNLPYQFDHVFCDEATAESMRFSKIDPHPAACLRLSDHAPVIVEFSL